MKVHILTTSNYISFFFFYPLLVNKKRFAELNVRIKYFDRILDNLCQCDVLLLDSKYFKTLWEDREYVLSLLQKMKSMCNKLIWLDSTASTGSTHFQVLPIVDKYLKKQLLKDLTLYKNDFYGARIYTDYYKNNFNIPEEEVARVDPIDEDHIHKLFISWNLAFGPYSSSRKMSNLFRLMPWSLKEKLKFNYHFKRSSSDTKRKYSVCFRGVTRYTNAALAFQRIKIIEKLMSRGVDTSPVKYKHYINELRNAKIAVSPFGAGELCYRDFEIFLAGALLFKPSMNHLVTWPDVFIEGETYISTKWDLSDFDEKIDILLQDTELVREMSLKAQDRYVSLFTSKMQETFCNRFVELLS